MCTVSLRETSTRVHYERLHHTTQIHLLLGTQCRNTPVHLTYPGNLYHEGDHLCQVLFLQRLKLGAGLRHLALKLHQLVTVLGDGRLMVTLCKEVGQGEEQGERGVCDKEVGEDERGVARTIRRGENKWA